MFKSTIESLALLIVVGVCPKPATAQPEQIAAGELLKPRWDAPKIVPIYPWEDTLYVMVVDDGCAQCFYKHRQRNWWDQAILCIEHDALEFFVSNSGTKYAYDYHENLLWYLFEYIIWYDIPCPGRPVIDNYENLHVIWDGSEDTVYYGFSTDTLSTFQVFDTLVSLPEFVYLVPSPDNSIIAALFYNSQSDSLYKYLAIEGNPIDFSSYQAFYCENSPSYAYDFMLDDHGGLIFVFDNERCWPWNWGSHDVWTEEYGARFLECADDEVMQPVCFEIAFGPTDGEILLIASNWGSNYLDSWFFMTPDGGDSWYRSGFTVDANYGSSPRTYRDTIDFVYDDLYTSYYYPIPRDIIMDDLTDIDETERILPGHISLSNYPNPFNSSTNISFTLPEAGYVKLDVYDIAGRLVNTLVDADVNSGQQTVIWDGTDQSGRPVSSGIYFYTLRSGNDLKSRRMLLIK